MHGHVAAVERPAARFACRVEQCRVQRAVDDVGHPQTGVQQRGSNGMPG